MKRLLSLLFVMLLIGHDLYAADWKPFMVLSVGESMDTLTTYRALQGGRCVEGNSRLGHYPSAGKLVIWTIMPVAGTAFATYVLTRPEMPKAAHIVGKLLSYGAGGWGGYHAVQNGRHCGW
jgi:hypothetical protein